MITKQKQLEKKYSQHQQDFIIENVKSFIVTSFSQDSSIRISKGRISEIHQGHLNGNEKRINGREQLLIPGLIDLHSDALEKAIEPRPNTIFPIELSLLEFDKNLSAAGITSMFHCVAFVQDDSRNRSLRNNNAAKEIIDTIKKLDFVLKSRAFIHLRFDLLNVDSMDLIKKIIDDNGIDLFSIMDHTPGQGQFLDLDKYFEREKQRYKGNRDYLLKEIQERQAIRNEVTDKQIKELIDYCLAHHIPLASHDDDSIEKIDKMRGLGISISEFPVAMDLMEYAHDHGIFTAVGSPNILLGGSHSGNLSAREAIANNCVNIICSDYLPHSLLHSLFYLECNDIIPLEQAIPLVTINPAKAVNLDSMIGSIEVGKKADMVLVETRSAIPRVLRTYIDGVEIYKTI
ncbi:MAG: alpha-D-ribose 1-methylphosphonate 5-triphosphate diphosphatase [Spirochaetales bacterium]|nr:alpha-D-ribose 1-methylphosphonate 5-triphosphate diphosphatase [Spirochaetales bacterium]